MSNYQERTAKREAENTSLHNALKDLGGGPNISPEWHAILALLRGGWPGNMTDAEAFAWPALLDDMPTEQVAAAVKRMHTAGTKFRPRPSEVRALLAPELTGAQKDSKPPAFDGAWAYILRSGAKSHYIEEDGHRWLRAHAHPSVAAWAKMRGLRTLWHMEVNCPDRGNLVRRDLSVAWLSHARDWEDPMLRPGIERIALTRPDAPSLESGNPRKVSAADFLPNAPAAIAEESTA